MKGEMMIPADSEVRSWVDSVKECLINDGSFSMIYPLDNNLSGESLVLTFIGVQTDPNEEEYFIAEVVEPFLCQASPISELIGQHRESNTTLYLAITTKSGRIFELRFGSCSRTAEAIAREWDAHVSAGGLSSHQLMVRKFLKSVAEKASCK
jgi:hypothetical protein